MPTEKGSKVSAVMYEEGSISSFTVTAGGSGYTSPPTVVITPAQGATATAVLTGGVVTSIIVNSGGANFVTAPAITFTGGGGTGAAATANISGYGVAPTLPEGLQLPIAEIDLKMQRAINKSRVLRGDRNPTKGFLGRKNVGGPLVMQPGVRDIAFLMKHLLGAVTTSGAGPYTHTIKVGTLPPGLTIDKIFGTLTQIERYLGCRLNQLSFSCNDDGLLEVTFDVIGASEVDDTVKLDAAPKLYSIQPFAVPKLTINEGGSPLTIGKDMQITISNNLDVETGRVMGNSGAINDLPEGIMMIDLSFSVLFQSVTLLNKAKNETVSSFDFTFPAPSAGHSLKLAFNELTYEVTEPGVKGPNGIVVPMKANVYYDTDAAASSVIATIINDVASIATIPA